MAELNLVVGQYLGKEVCKFRVEDTMRVDQFVSLAVRMLRLPLTDLLNLPLFYRLRTEEGGDFFLGYLTLREAGIGNGMKLVVVAVEVFGQGEAPATGSRQLPDDISRTLTKQAQSGPRLPLADRSFRRTRRTVLFLMGLLVAGTGLGGGVLVAESQRTANPLAGSRAAHSNAGVPLAPRIVTIFSAHQGNVRRALFSPNGAFLCSGGDDGCIFVWKQDGTIVQKIASADVVRALAWSPDATQLAAGIGKRVAFFDARAGIQLASHTPHTGVVTDLAWTQTSPSLVVSTGLDTQAFVWGGETHSPLRVFRGHTAAIEAVDVSSATAATASLGGVVRVWSMQNAQEVHGYFFDRTQQIKSVAFSPSGVLAVGGGDGMVRLWNGLICQRMGQDRFGERCNDLPQLLQGGASPIHALRFSSDGKLLASGSTDGTVTIWSIRQRTALFAWSLHGDITSLAWSPTNHHLAVAQGRQVAIWHIPSVHQ